MLRTCKNPNINGGGGNQWVYVKLSALEPVEPYTAFTLSPLLQCSL